MKSHTVTETEIDGERLVPRPLRAIPDHVELPVAPAFAEEDERSE